MDDTIRALQTQINALKTMIWRLSRHTGVRCGTMGGERNRLSCVEPLGHNPPHRAPTGDGKTEEWY